MQTLLQNARPQLVNEKLVLRIFVALLLLRARCPLPCIMSAGQHGMLLHGHHVMGPCSLLHELQVTFASCAPLLRLPTVCRLQLTAGRQQVINACVDRSDLLPHLLLCGLLIWMESQFASPVFQLIFMIQALLQQFFNVFLLAVLLFDILNFTVEPVNSLLVLLHCLLQIIDLICHIATFASPLLMGRHHCLQLLHQPQHILVLTIEDLADGLRHVWG